MTKRTTLTVKERTTLALQRFRYEAMDEESKWEWYPIEDEKGHARMMRLLGGAYHNTNLILRAMQAGQTGHTLFVKFRAIRLDADNG